MARRVEMVTRRRASTPIAIVWAAVIGCGAAAAGCDGEDDPATCAQAQWRAAIPELDRSILSAWGTASDDVWMVGGDLGVGGTGAALIHWDGRSFTEVPTGEDRSLWWIWGSSDGETLWIAGERGVVLRRQGDRIESIPSGIESTLFGAWGAGPDDVWIVGGTPGAGEPDKDLILHWDGHALVRETLPSPRGTTLLKIWGSGPDDIWVSGEGGTLWRRDAGGWVDRSAELDTFSTLFSVHGCGPDEVYTVGGPDVFRFDGGSWSHVAEAEALLLGSAAGVSCGEDAVMVVGAAGLKLRFDRATGAWTDDTLAEPWDADLHAAWISPDGDIWVVGGNYAAPASSIDRRTGVAGYYGCASPAWP